MTKTMNHDEDDLPVFLLTEYCVTCGAPSKVHEEFHWIFYSNDETDIWWKTNLEHFRESLPVSSYLICDTFNPWIS